MKKKKQKSAEKKTKEFWFLYMYKFIEKKNMMACSAIQVP